MKIINVKTLDQCEITDCKTCERIHDLSTCLNLEKSHEYIDTCYDGHVF
jgi:hypothetical protein